jgi:branched-chain amino acid transport system ATP-binding protein
MDELDSASLEVTDLVVTFGGLRAVDRASLRVPGEGIVGLIGPNGAGKTTLIDAVTGFVPVAEGSIIFGGQDITNRSAHRRAQRKLSRTFQSLELFEDLTVAENVRISTETGHWWRNLAEVFRPRVNRPDVAWALGQFDLQDVADRVPGELSQAQRKYLALARAIAARPKVLLLDEPAAGLDRAGTEDLGLRLRHLVAEGIGLLLVDHDMALVLNVCDLVYVLDTGRVIACGTPSEIRRNPDVLRAYLGEDEPMPSATDVTGNA